MKTTAKQVIQRLKTIATSTDGVHFSRQESQALRELAEYLMRSSIGPHAKTVEMIIAKVPK